MVTSPSDRLALFLSFFKSRQQLSPAPPVTVNMCRLLYNWCEMLTISATQKFKSYQHSFLFSLLQTLDGKALKNFKKTKKREDVHKALVTYITENPSVKVRTCLFVCFLVSV